MKVRQSDLLYSRKTSVSLVIMWMSFIILNPFQNPAYSHDCFRPVFCQFCLWRFGQRVYTRPIARRMGDSCQCLEGLLYYNNTVLPVFHWPGILQSNRNCVKSRISVLMRTGGSSTSVRILSILDQVLLQYSPTNPFSFISHGSKRTWALKNSCSNRGWFFRCLCWGYNCFKTTRCNYHGSVIGEAAVAFAYALHSFAASATTAALLSLRSSFIAACSSPQVYTLVACSSCDSTLAYQLEFSRNKPLLVTFELWALIALPWRCWWADRVLRQCR